MSSPLRQALPNAITIARLALAAAFFAILAALGGEDREGRALLGNLAVVLFIVAAATDMLDGWLARRWGAVSVFGRIMDPFCDKVLVLGAFVFLAGPPVAWPDAWSSAAAAPDAAAPEAAAMAPATGVWPWMVVVILARELLVTSLRGVLESKGIDFSADRAGKWKMLIQSVCVPVCLFVAVNEAALQSRAWTITRDVLVWATVLVTIWSVVPYILRARRLLT